MNTENITWLTSPMKQTTFKVELAAETVLVHLSLQVFRDYVWVLLTEDANNAPGTIVRYDDPACGPLAYTYEGENRLNTVECVELLGLRDNPLTQLSSRVVMNTVRRTGDTRPVLLYNSVYHLSKKLKGTGEKQAFLTEMQKQLQSLF